MSVGLADARDAGVPERYSQLASGRFNSLEQAAAEMLS